MRTWSLVVLSGIAVAAALASGACSKDTPEAPAELSVEGAANQDPCRDFGEALRACLLAEEAKSTRGAAVVAITLRNAGSRAFALEPLWLSRNVRGGDYPPVYLEFEVTGESGKPVARQEWIFDRVRSEWEPHQLLLLGSGDSLTRAFAIDKPPYSFLFPSTGRYRVVATLSHRARAWVETKLAAGKLSPQALRVSPDQVLNATLRSSAVTIEVGSPEDPPKAE